MKPLRSQESRFFFSSPPLAKGFIISSRPHRSHVTRSPEPGHPSASSEFSKVNHWSHQNRVEDQDDLLTRLQIIYFIPTGARHRIFHLGPVLRSWDLSIRLDNEVRLPCACGRNLSLSLKVEGAASKDGHWLKVGANLLTLRELSFLLANLGQKMGNLYDNS